MKKILAALFLLLAAPALAQQAVQQSGFVTPGHVPAWVTNGVIGDAGSAQSPSLTSIGTVGQGNTICANSGPQTGPYNQLCLGANLNSAAQIVLQNYGGASPQSLQVVVNGTTFTVPFGGGGSTPCTTTALSLQYNAAGSLGCVSQWTSDGTHLIPVLGSDATGDLYYRNASGFLTRLGIGTTNQVLTVSSGLPSWQAASGGGGTPCTTTALSVQYNASGSFGCVAGVTSNGTTLTIASGDLLLAGSGSGTTTVNASATASGTLTLPAATDTLIGKATTDTLTNKTYDTAGTGNTFKINGTGITAISGNTATVGSTSGAFTSGNCVKTDANHNLIDNGSGCAGAPSGGGPIFPSSIYLGGASGNLSPTFFIPSTNTNAAGAIEGTGVVGSLGSDSTAVIQFNLPENLPSGTLKLRTLMWAPDAHVGKLTVSDGVTAATNNIGASTLTAETQISITATVDVINENKTTLTTAAVANSIYTIKAVFNTSGWTITGTSVWQFSLVWE